MYSVRMRHTFEDLIAHYKVLKRLRVAHPYVMLATQYDATDSERVVAREEALFMADAFGCTMFETSARTGTNVAEAVSHVVELLIEAEMRVRRRRCSLSRLAGRIVVHR